jgi:hypothetical protein
MPGNVLPVSPYTGNWAAWLGGLLNETSSLTQMINITSSPATLRFYYRIGSADACGRDYARIGITPPGQERSVVQTLDLCTSNNTSGWTQATVDLSAYVGQSVELSFEVTTDGANHSSFLLDEVQLTVPESATPTPTATPTSAPTTSPLLSINYPDGAPGSSFLVVGDYFPAGATVQLSINGVPVGSLFTVEQDGRFRALIATDSSAAEGYYVIVAAVTTAPASLAQPSSGATDQQSYQLAATAPARQAPPSAPPAVAVPPSIPAFAELPVVYLPLVRR